MRCHSKRGIHRWMLFGPVHTPGRRAPPPSQLQQAHISSKPPNTEQSSYRKIRSYRDRTKSAPDDNQVNPSNRHRQTVTPHVRTAIMNPNQFDHSPAQRKSQATMPEERKSPWYCKVCDVWCHSHMKTCPRCIKKQSLRFPRGDSFNPGFRVTIETRAGGTQPRGSDGEREGGEDVSAAAEQ